ncbi:MAG TPA: rhomboid family intramembrane serine protease, partial [Chloroflexota bacterium]|nr:rhomboid family intramembrane serine protease [Chloroflexota bacterium]
MILTSMDYEELLRRSQAVLDAEGAQPLDLPPLAGGSPHDAAWDLLLLHNAPGAGTIYAFTSRQQPDEVRRMEDGLARALSGSGILRGVPVHLVTVVAVSGADSEGARRSLVRVTPSTFYQGLRPATWVADLDDRHVHTPGFRRPAEAEALQRAWSSPGVLSHDEATAMQRASISRQQAFFQLIQGRQPVVTYALIVVNVAIFALMYANNINSESTLRDFGALSPVLVERGQWWRLFASMFLHASVAHILFNMMSLFAVGTLAERLYGSAKYMGIYLGAGLIG